MEALKQRFPWLIDRDAGWLRSELLLRAAAGFEQVGRWPDAAECLADLGDPRRAAELYVRGGHFRQAADALLTAHRHEEALEQYRQWESQLPAGDVVNRVRAMLGQATCHHLGVHAGQSGSALSLRAALETYRRARAIIETEGEHSAIVAARCWTALAEYGTWLGRPDLVQTAYEQALRHLEATSARREWINVSHAYLAAVRRHGDRALVRALEERLAEFGEWRPTGEWETQRQIIESHLFRDAARDVLHFTDPAQWEAWRTLAGMEGQPELDEYMRTLAPEGMVYIPPGAFLMGSPDEDPDAEDGEKPQHEVWLPGYYIDRYPVTNAEYRKFVDAGGYECQEYWTDAGWREKTRYSWEEPRDWRGDRFIAEQQPVIGVSWYEAIAYSRWAGKALLSEAQWEKAASWVANLGTKRTFPWGDRWDVRNCHIVNMDRPAKVGSYSPQGDSAYGVGDMGGNVYEWCSTRWDDGRGHVYIYPYRGNDGREDHEHYGSLLRVVRGARWGAPKEWAEKTARSTSRTGHDPGYWYDYRGFRCSIHGR